jgi:hypothetical protein
MKFTERINKFCMKGFGAAIILWYFIPPTIDFSLIFHILNSARQYLFEWSDSTGFHINKAVFLLIALKEVGSIGVSIRAGGSRTT